MWAPGSVTSRFIFYVFFKKNFLKTLNKANYIKIYGTYLVFLLILMFPPLCGKDQSNVKQANNSAEDSYLIKPNYKSTRLLKKSNVLLSGLSRANVFLPVILDSFI